MMCLSGAKNSSSWEKSVNSKYVPLPSSLAYEGVYNEHFFDTGFENEKILSVTCSPLTTRDPISGKKETFLVVGLNSKYDGDGFSKHGGRPPLDFVVLLDVSGSMGESFERKSPGSWAQGQSSEEIIAKTKLQLALESLKVLMSRLTVQDSFGLVTFDSDAEVLIPLSNVGTLDKARTAAIIDGIACRGSTDLSAGLRCAYRQFPESPPLPTGRGRRVFVLTDDNTNTGDTSAGSLVDIVSTAAAAGIYTTTVGTRPSALARAPRNGPRDRHRLPIKDPAGGAKPTLQPAASGVVSEYHRPRQATTAAGRRDGVGARGQGSGSTSTRTWCRS